MGHRCSLLGGTATLWASSWSRPAREIFYLAVDPDAWGCGIGSRLLLSAEDHARKVGRETLELWVINDNQRAIRVYERSGWLGTDEVKRDTRSGRLERRFLRHVRQVQRSWIHHTASVR